MGKEPRFFVVGSDFPTMPPFAVVLYSHTHGRQTDIHFDAIHLTSMQHLAEKPLKLRNQTKLAA